MSPHNFVILQDHRYLKPPILDVQRRFPVKSQNPNSQSPHTSNLRWENRPANRPPNRETGLEMPCCPATDLLWVQITQTVILIDSDFRAYPVLNPLVTL